MSVEQTIVIGIISSIIASIVFYLLMILIKPRFVISDKISCIKVDDEYMDYMIKIVNKTRSVITNVNYMLTYCVEGEDGIVEIYTVAPLKSPIMNIDKYTRKNTDYAVRITYRIRNGEYVLKENTFFDFTFQAYHSFSNAMRIKKQIFYKNPPLGWAVAPPP